MVNSDYFQILGLNKNKYLTRSGGSSAQMLETLKYDVQQSFIELDKEEAEKEGEGASLFQQILKFFRPQSAEYVSAPVSESRKQLHAATTVLMQSDLALIYLMIQNKVAPLSREAGELKQISIEELQEIREMTIDKIQQTPDEEMQLFARSKGSALSLNKHAGNSKIIDCMVHAIAQYLPIRKIRKDTASHPSAKTSYTLDDSDEHYQSVPTIQEGAKISFPEQDVCDIENDASMQNKSNKQGFFDKISERIQQGSMGAKAVVTMALVVIFPMGIAYLISQHNKDSQSNPVYDEPSLFDNSPQQNLENSQTQEKETEILQPFQKSKQVNYTALEDAKRAANQDIIR